MAAHGPRCWLGGSWCLDSETDARHLVNLGTSSLQAAWLWWLDIDTAMVNLTRQLPLDTYTGRDLIGWGNYERLQAGDMMQGEVGQGFGAGADAARKPSNEKLYRINRTTIKYSWESGRRSNILGNLDEFLFGPQVSTTASC